MQRTKLGFNYLLCGFLTVNLAACIAVIAPTPEPSALPPSPTTSPRPTATPLASPIPEPTPSEELIYEQARPQDVILDVNLNNISAEFSSYYGATLTVERQDEGIIYQRYFFPATELGNPLRFQPGDLTTGQSFTVHLSGTPDGNCLNQVILGLKPEQSSGIYLEAPAYRHALNWELNLNSTDFSRLATDLSCRLGYTLEGRVMDEAGEALEGVSILAEILDENAAPVYRNLQISTATGIFSLSSLPSGTTVSLAFSKPGYRSFQTYYADKSGSVTPEASLSIYLKPL